MAPTRTLAALAFVAGLTGGSALADAGDDIASHMINKPSQTGGAFTVRHRLASW